MANVPLIYGPDGVLRDQLNFTTTLNSRFFTGTAPPNTVDLELSVQGRAFSNSADLISFDGEIWTVPNPEVYPDGLDLVPGNNTIQIRAVLATGSLTGSSSINVRFIQSNDVGTIALAPTNISINQQTDQVVLVVDGVDDPQFLGINYYASQYPGGGATGYTRININTVSSYATVEEIADIGSFNAEAEVIKNPDGTVAADPLYAGYSGSQVDSNGIILQSDFSQTVLIPDGTDRIRSSVSLASVTVLKRYSFEHNRTNTVKSSPPTVFVNAFATLQNTDPLYYVSTAVYYDPINLVEFESPFSMEVLGHPLVVNTTTGNFPVVSRQQITRNVIETIFRSNPQVKVEAGSYLRDVFIDPFASEAERLRFIVDFLHRAQSFISLLQIDDPNNTNTSIPSY
mgnify:CR=1 FL=1